MVDSSPLKAEGIIHSPPQSPFRPPIVPLAYKFSPPFSPPVKTRFPPIRELSPFEPVELEPEAPHLEVHDEQQSDEISQDELVIEAKQEEYNKDKESEIDEALSRLISENASIDEPIPTGESVQSTTQLFGRIVIWLLIVAATYTLFSYKMESSAIGYCDRGTNTSHTLETILAQRSAFEACTKEGRPFLPSSVNNSSNAEVDKMDESCPLPPLLPMPHPDSCTPCPDHATCDQFSVTCDSGYLLKPNLLLSFIPVSPSQSTLATSHAPGLGKAILQAFSSATSGLPGFGSVGLPPRCVEDPQRKRHIGALGKAIESMLGRERGRRVCHGERVNAAEPPVGPGAAVKWGVELNKLKEAFRQSASVRIISFSVYQNNLTV
jgi:hypothetical protein